jgi:hypothetical protein
MGRAGWTIGLDTRSMAAGRGEEMWLQPLNFSPDLPYLRATARDQGRSRKDPMATIRIPLIANSADALEQQVSAQLEALPPGCTPTIDRGEIWDRRTGAASVAIIYHEG